jgi:hypothetical protein
MCKEEIKEGAKKCPICAEMLAPGRKMQRWFFGVLSGSFSLVVALASLGFAYLEYQGRVEAVQEKEVVQAQKQAAEDILQKISPSDLQAALQEVQVDLTQRLERQPQNAQLQESLLYTNFLLQK